MKAVSDIFLDPGTSPQRLPTRDSNPGIPHPGIQGSRPILSIPNPGIGDALIPGFRDYEKCKNFTGYLPEKYLFPEIWRQFPALKLTVNGFENFDTNTNYAIMVDSSTDAIVLNELFMRHLTLLYSISLDA